MVHIAVVSCVEMQSHFIIKKGILLNLVHLSHQSSVAVGMTRIIKAFHLTTGLTNPAMKCLFSRMQLMSQTRTVLKGGRFVRAPSNIHAGPWAEGIR